MVIQEMLRVITRHTFKATFPVMEAAVKLSQRTKTIEKIALHLEYFLYTWNTLATPPIYNQVYPGKIATASPGNPMDDTKPSLLSLCEQQDEKCLEELTSLEETNVLTTFRKKSMRKIRSESEIASIPTVLQVA